MIEPMNDRYLSISQCVRRLINDYKAHNSLFVAFDYDNTIFDYHNVGDKFPKLIDILKECKSVGLKLILFTGNEGEKLEKIVDRCKSLGITPDYINENPLMKTRKPYYNILLDDRAGLDSAYETLLLTLNYIKNEF